MLIGGWALALTVCPPEIPREPLTQWGENQPTELVRQSWHCLALGPTLCGPLFIARRAWRRLGLSLGAWLWLAAGLGGWIFVPPLAAGSPKDSTFLCAILALSISSFWLVLAGMLSGQWRPLRRNPGLGFTERAGWGVLSLWAPLGAWWILDCYAEAFGWPWLEMGNWINRAFRLVV